jgi:transcriptional regulator with XRE-family HTH domain
VSAKPTPKRTDQHLGEQVKIARKSKGWLQSDLANRLRELGFTGWRQSKVAKIENGETKRVSLEDALALAVALGVQPAHLLAPKDGVVEIVPKLAVPAHAFRMWLRGHAAFRQEDEKDYFTGALVPEQEWREFTTGVSYAGKFVVGEGVAIVTSTTSSEGKRRATLRFDARRPAKKRGKDA